MAWTSDDLDRINKAIASGTLRVKFQDKEITYRSIEELQKIRRQIEEELGTSTKKTRVRAKFSKGLD